MTVSTTIPPGRIGELTRYFLRLGLLGFGGPVALVGQMERELVDDRGWLTKEQMREAIAICQSLAGTARDPGRHLHRLSARRFLGRLGRRLGLHPSELRDRGRAWAHSMSISATCKPVTAIFYGVSPAVIALILHSCYRLAKLGMEDWLQWAIAAVCLVVTVILQAEVALLFIGAGFVGILYYGNLFRRPPPAALSLAVAAGSGAARAHGLELDARQASAVFPQGRVRSPSAAAS